MPADLVIGVVGPRDLVDRVVLGARQSDRMHAVRLTSVAYRQEDEAVARVRRAQSRVDALLFTGPLPYDLVQESGRLAVPATYISLAGDAFYSALLRCVLDHAGDPSRISVDTITRDDVADAYGDIGVSVDGVHVHPYQGPETSEALADFHQRLYRENATTAALTCVHSVHRRLVQAGVPSVRVLPSSAATRAALRAAELMGRGGRLEESQIAIGIVVIPGLRQSADAMPHQWSHELRLAAHRALIHEARRMGATVLPMDSDSFIVIATLGSLGAATDDLREPPFVGRLKTELGVDANVGIGLGRTAEEAESNARVAVRQVSTSTRAHAVVGGPDRGDGGNSVQPDGAGTPTHVLQVHRKLTARLRDQPVGPDEPVIVDAARVAQILGVPDRSARRSLRALADAGLAWQLPQGSDTRPGRPRQRYRLLTQPDTSASGTSADAPDIGSADEPRRPR